MKALILVDLQIDFCALGALEVPGAEEIIPMANQLIDKFDLVIATKDWHPGNHVSFAANHLWRYPGQTIELDGLEQILWPIHCVQESFGSEFHSALASDKIDHIIFKGMNPKVDSYSGFYDNGRQSATSLEDLLKANQVSEIYIMGLATDYCVKYTALDARHLGFKTWLIADACRGVEQDPEIIEAVFMEMKNVGVQLIDAKTILGQ